jgi:hypothetical protein
MDTELTDVSLERASDILRRSAPWILLSLAGLRSAKRSRRQLAGRWLFVLGPALRDGPFATRSCCAAFEAVR